MTPATVYKCGSSDLDGRPNTFKRGKDCTPAPEEPVIQDFRINEPEWRELGPDEVICEGDEIQWPYKDWQTAKSSIGYKVGYWDGLVKSRTRRPLPKSQEEAPDDLHSWMRLQEKINREVAGELYYFRNEIEKLKTK